MISGKKKRIENFKMTQTELSYFCFFLEPVYQKFKLGVSSFPLTSLGNQNEIHYEQEINNELNSKAKRKKLLFLGRLQNC